MSNYYPSVVTMSLSYTISEI